ncbi:hypothetical protein KS878_004594 [Vibrio parahaemolyticus]|nr:hypothetical protein [uncultured Vibrio sp.]EHR1015845.1 hypothetical protein [Vibrio parahaemolyticus]
MSACFWLGFAFQFLALRVCENRASVVFVVLNLLFQKPIHLLKVSFGILSFSNELFGVVSPFSMALHIQSGFSGGRFETAPDLSFSTNTKTVLAKRQSTSNQSFRFGN